MRPPSGNASNRCDDVYWSTPMTRAPRCWRVLKALSAWSCCARAGAGTPARVARTRRVEIRIVGLRGGYEERRAVRARTYPGGFRFPSAGTKVTPVVNLSEVRRLPLFAGVSDA